MSVRFMLCLYRSIGLVSTAFALAAHGAEDLAAGGGSAVVVSIGARHVPVLAGVREDTRQELHEVDARRTGRPAKTLSLLSLPAKLLDESSKRQVRVLSVQEGRHVDAEEVAHAGRPHHARALGRAINDVQRVALAGQVAVLAVASLARLAHVRGKVRLTVIERVDHGDDLAVLGRHTDRATDRRPATGKPELRHRDRNVLATDKALVAVEAEPRDTAGADVGDLGRLEALTGRDLAESRNLTAKRREATVSDEGLDGAGLSGGVHKKTLRQHSLQRKAYFSTVHFGASLSGSLRGDHERLRLDNQVRDNRRRKPLISLALLDLGEDPTALPHHERVVREGHGILARRKRGDHRAVVGNDVDQDIRAIHARLVLGADHGAKRVDALTDVARVDVPLEILDQGIARAARKSARRRSREVGHVERDTSDRREGREVGEVIVLALDRQGPQPLHDRRGVVQVLLGDFDLVVAAHVFVMPQAADVRKDYC